MSQGIPPTSFSKTPVAAHNTESANSDGQTSTKFSDLVFKIQSGDPAASQDLHRIFGRGLQLLLARSLRTWHPDLVEKIESEVIAVVQETPGFGPDRLLGLVHATFRANITDATARPLTSDGQYVPRRTTIQIDSTLRLQEMAEHAVESLRGLSALEREVVHRYYLQGQSPGEIRSAMNLDEMELLSLLEAARRYLKALRLKTLPPALQFRTVAGNH